MTEEASRMRPFTPHVNPWRRVSNKRVGDTLTLNEIVVLRRLSGGLSQTAVAHAIGWPKTTVFDLLRTLRARFGVDSNEDLLALPRVAEQLKEDGAA